MIPDDTPPPTPEPGSSLVPPVRRPPTAVSADAPFPSPRERGRVWLRQTSVAHSAEKLVRYLFDAMDVLGDTVAEGLGLRKRPEDRPGEPPPAA